ncbi:SDR family oxidoreductase [Novosphingobium profundi]|uniref:SDR family oxidoreductase n=1 Tax=Novosphingobium profundi TaxID=1774954 RepID=UPI001CFD5AA9|nr:SDR family oxidoreductase [Novosphingobium profundi]
MAGRYIVTGGFGVLGRAVCAQLCREGHRVGVIDMAPCPDGYEGLAEGGIDLTEAAAVGPAVARMVTELGGLDGLVNVAGGFVWEPLGPGSPATFERMYRTNLHTATTTCEAVLETLAPGGAIVNIGAAAARDAGEGMGAYAASKAGVMALTQALAAQLKPQGIRVNAVLPTVLDTPTNRADMPDADPGKWIAPAAAAQVIAWLLSPAASCVTGEGIALSMGQGKEN